MPIKRWNFAAEKKWLKGTAWYYYSKPTRGNILYHFCYKQVQLDNLSDRGNPLEHLSQSIQGGKNTASKLELK